MKTSELWGYQKYDASLKIDIFNRTYKVSKTERYDENGPTAGAGYTIFFMRYCRHWMQMLLEEEYQKIDRFL